MTGGAVLSMAVSLAVDATTLAATYGLAMPALRARHVLGVGLLFGGFHGVMPLAGSVLSEGLLPHLAGWERWVAAFIFIGLGARMVWVALRQRGHDVRGSTSLSMRRLVPLAFASSLDAFAAGLALPALGARLAVSLVSIAVTTAVLSGVGLMVGHRLGASCSSRCEGGAGLVLVGLGFSAVV